MLEKFSVKKPYTVFVTVLLVIILGVVSFMEMTPDLLPSLELPYAVVATTYVGASPEEVETVVTKPIEQVLSTLNNLENISSASSENVSIVTLEFGDETNMDAMGVDIREKLDTISGYWDDSVGSPLILKLNPDMMPVMVAAVDVEGMDTAEVSAYVENEIIPQLESTEGVASISKTGLVDNQIQVVISQKKLDRVNESIEKALNKKLDKAEKELKKAKKDIESGKEEIEQKKDELTSGMTQASSAISSARLDLLKKEIEMADGKAELTAKEEELKKADEELTAKEKEFAENEAKVTAGLKEAEEGLAQIEAALPMLPEEQKAAMEEKKAEVEATIQTLKETQETLEEAKPELVAAREQITEGMAAVETAKAQMEEGSKQLEDGKKQLDSKEEELELQKSQANSKLNEASTQIVSGENEVKNQLDSFEDTRKDAIEQADVSNKITSDMVTKILQAEHFSMPAGYVQEDNIDYLVRVGDKLSDLEEIQNLVLFDMDLDDLEPIRLTDVADVFYSDTSDETYAKINGNPGVMLTFQKQTSYATATVSENLKNKFEELQGENEQLTFNVLMDQGIYIDYVIGSVMNNLIMGGILAILILFLFLWDLRPTFIVACSIPLSVIFAIVLMYFSGVSINIISLSGLTVGVGMLVDNSVVVIENIYRLRRKGVPAMKAAVAGAKQVSGAIISSTLTTVGVFLPIVFVKGISRQLFTDMALTIGYSLGASLIVALTLVPAMSSRMLRKTKTKESVIMNGFTKGYEKLLRGALKLKPVVLILAVVLLVASVLGAYKNGTAFMPDMDSTQISLTIEMPEGTTLEDTVAMSDEIVERIQTIEDVDTVGAMLANGRASMLGMGDSSAKTDSVSMYALLKEDKKHSSQEIAKEIEKLCEGLECEVEVSASTMDMSMLGGSGVSVRITGTELDILKEQANKIAAEIEKVEGTKNVSNGIEDPTEEIRIVVDKEKAMLKGLTVAGLYMDIQEAIADASSATTLTYDGSDYEILVSEDTKTEMTPEDIKNYKVKYTNQEGEEKKVKLSKIAEIKEDYSLSTISRESQQRYIEVTAEIEDGYNIGNVSRQVEKQLNDIEMPAGYKLVFGGENETINEALGQLTKMLLLAIAFIYLIMVAQFQSLLSPFIVMFTIPLAFTGGFLGLFFTGNELSVIAMIGFVMLSGVVVNNGIVLVDCINQLRDEGMEKKEAIIEAGKTRMRPILMTALTTILGLSTMAAAVGMGAEMMQPVAIVTIGGLLYATITTLFVIPALYDLFHRKDRKVVRDADLDYVEED